MNKKHSFLNDYSEGCHEQVLAALADCNGDQQAPYGADQYSQRARALIAEKCRQPGVATHFVSTGTMANLVALAAALRPHEAVVAATSAHINVHETGAIEATGHKILTMASNDGKLSPRAIGDCLAQNALFPHMAKPRLVYLSNATELGSVYTHDELAEISALCRERQLLLMIDGARLGVATNTEACAVTLADVARYADIFWIGGTKNGALFGEALVIPNQDIAVDFDFHVKQRGALMAKGRALGAQFLALFDNDLFDTLARHANEMAQHLARGIADKGHQFTTAPVSNQLFPVLPNAAIERLQSHFDFYVWRPGETESVVRLVTSWATPESAVEEFLELL